MIGEKEFSGIKNEDESALASRMLRYGRTSGTVAGLAARLAGEKFLGIKIDKEEHALQLMQALAGLKGPVMKIGQILATIPEALPPEYAVAFQQLQANAPPMGRAFVRRRMKSELGPEWESKFKSFQFDAAAAASLGQVHQAESKDGIRLACKLQYPDMNSAIEADLRQLRMVFNVFEKYDRAIHTRYIHDELSARLFEELDYCLEAKHCRLYAGLLEKESEVHIPRVINELSTKRLLTSTWLDGEPILKFVDAHPERRNRLAMNMFRVWYVPFYQAGIIHGDPHLGNYSVRKDDSINLLDFGCVRTFRAEFVEGVIWLYNSLLNNDKDLSVRAYETWGFKGLTNEQIETLNIWARFLYAPLLEDKVRLIGEANKGVYGRETAIQVHRKLREIGGVTVPREFVFMDRAALGLGSVFIHLKAEINWHRLFGELIENFDADTMRVRQAEVLDQFGVPLPD